MSVNEQINRIQQAKTDIQNALNDKGISVPTTTKIDEISPYIENAIVGDMKKSVYDINNNGIVDNSETLGGYTLSEIMLMMYPVGSIKFSLNNINPSTYIGGTWARIGGGMVPVGVNEVDDDFAANMTGGEKTHTLTVSEMPSHDHPGVTLDGTKLGLNRDNTGVNGWGTSLTNRSIYGEFIAGKKGGGAAHNNMPPYFTCYIWERIA